jgi:aspartyl-tRNA(Asn)/glutamyl-tRNA(Gln) amidotransferase subunit A
MKSLAFASIAELAALLKNRTISLQDVVRQTQERFAQYDAALGSALEVFDAESILKHHSFVNTPLQGIPGLIKDNICQQGRITSCASKILDGYTAPYDATVAMRLKQAGALLMGRANCDEFAMGSSTETSAHKRTCNPWDHTRVPGGSSGGSAAAVAAGLVPWALGSETGGSVRQPAALCGIVGLKPTYGRISRYGLVAYGSSVDQVGIFTRTVTDCAQVLQAIAGRDERDPSSADVEVDNYVQRATGKMPRVRIGVIQNALNAAGIHPEVRERLDAAIAQLEKLGAQIVPITLPTMDYSAAVYFVLSRAEAASNLARFDGIRYGPVCEGDGSLQSRYQMTRTQLFGDEVRRRIMIGTYVLSAGHADAYYNRALAVQKIMKAEFAAAFKDVDLLFSPVSPAPAFKFGAFADNPLQMDLQDYFTAAANLVGIPALALPCGFAEGLPTGFQLMGPAWSEGELFAVGSAYEACTQWHTHKPPQYS